MTNVQDLYTIIEDILFSRHTNIDIILPYYNKKKDVGPKLASLLKEAGIPVISSTPQDWIVATEKGHKRINFSTSLIGHGHSCIVIIQDERKEK